MAVVMRERAKATHTMYAVEFSVKLQITLIVLGVISSKCRYLK